jgi:hypothetical protein
MKKEEVNQAVELALSKEEIHDDDMVLNGLYLRDFKPVSTTIRVVAKFLRWHCVYLNGGVASEELNEFIGFARKRIQIVG